MSLLQITDPATHLAASRNPLSGTVPTVGDLGKSRVRVSSISRHRRKKCWWTISFRCVETDIHYQSFVRALAHLIARQRRPRLAVSRDLADGDDVRPPRKNWPQVFVKRRRKLKATRIKALDAN
ncbi:hypothetical protein LIPSTDRAFT_106035 [Lipomyces starkeyi NRRL Y-11557]|uniref:Uncharacterized protein n=1 Tax=Lipomyces starkeyi NRRL Y-11557 TaxID=675824 RepID=A0A1E3Q226_LIPST|nr:hypothetical protein LIPSTDRAFT_106035 [Lipomyces starkeyi NRRL Y-11557]